MNEDGDVNYKAGAQFGDHMKGKSEAQVSCPAPALPS